MANRRSASSAVAIVGFSLALAGCGGATDPTVATTTTVASSTTSEALATTTTSTAEGPQTLVSGGFLEPGEYVTTVFEPTVLYRIEQEHLLRAFQNQRVTGFENYLNVRALDDDAEPFRGIGIQNIWLGLTPEEVLEKLKEIERIELGRETPTEVGGFPGRRFEAVASNRVGLWITLNLSGGDEGRTWYVQEGPLDIIILETPAGTLLITIAAPADEWDEFLTIADEILAGVSFPDLD